MKTTKTSRLRLRLKVTPAEIDFAAVSWYQDATRLIQDLYGEDWRLFVDFLAATSPRSQVKRNWRLADWLIRGYRNRREDPKAFGDLLGDLMPAHRINVLRALQGKPIQGPKVSRFAANLKGDLDKVTIDTWICKAYGIDHKALTPKVYDRLEKQIQRDAAKANTTPAGLQAVIWYAVRRKAGLRARSFVKVYREIFAETPCFDFMK